MKEYIVDVNDSSEMYAVEMGRYEELRELIRCKDCKHSEPWYRDRRRCFLWAETGIDVWNDGFCNYAERKEE